MKSQGKIFGIGAPKTGTSSLGRAMKILGFNHRSWEPTLSKKYRQGDYEPIFRVTEDYESFEDGPWNQGEFYQKLDERFPGSKFILTVRESSSWIESYEKHFAAKQLRENPYELWIRRYDEQQKASKVTWYEERNRGILKYFQNRKADLLVINICGGEGWETLCPFLELPQPNTPFPRANITASRDLSTLGIWKIIIQSAVGQSKNK